jgi:hypothetical protein
MANTLTNLQDVRIADTFLKTFVAALTPLRAFSTDFSSEFIERGKTVNVPVVGGAGASYDFAGSYSQNMDSNVDSLPVVLDRHKVQSLHLTDKEVSESSWPTMERLAEEKARQLAEDVLKDIWSIVTISNYGAAAIPAIAAADFDADTVLSLRGVCATRNIPVASRNLLINDAYYTNLLGDPKISQSYLAQMSAPALMEARIPRIYGFDVYETTIMPENAQNLVGFVAHPRSMVVAMRYLQPLRPESYLEAGAVTDPQTGITIGYRRFYDNDSGKEIAAFECVYGRRTAITDGLLRIEKPGA